MQKRGLTNRFHCECRAVTSYFVGHGIDRRMDAALRKQGFVGENKSETLTAQDFYVFDYFFAATRDVMSAIEDVKPVDFKGKIYLATHFNEQKKDADIEDPYYGGEKGFNDVTEFIAYSAESIMNFLQDLPYSPA